MEGDRYYPDEPYRLAVALEDDAWKAYGLDDAGQERHLGRIVREKRHTYRAISACRTYEVAFASVDEAAAKLYERCMESGYLQKGHPNYLKEVLR